MNRIRKMLSALVASAVLVLVASAGFAGVPEGFVPAYANETEQVKIVEYIPKGETVEAWSEMYTFLVLKQVNAAQYVSFARNLGEQLQGSCEGAKLRGQHMDAQKMYLLAFECPEASIAKGQSESMVGMVRPYKQNVLSVQYARRGEKGTPPDSAAMLGKLHELVRK